MTHKAPPPHIIQLARKLEDCTWDYRVLRRELPGGEVIYGIYEVYYNKDGKPIACTEAADVENDSIEDLHHQLNLMLEALGLPVLDYNTDFKPKKEKDSDR